MFNIQILFLCSIKTLLNLISLPHLSEFVSELLFGRLGSARFRRFWSVPVGLFVLILWFFWSFFFADGFIRSVFFSGRLFRSTRGHRGGPADRRVGRFGCRRLTLFFWKQIEIVKYTLWNLLADSCFFCKWLWAWICTLQNWLLWFSFSKKKLTGIFYSGMGKKQKKNILNKLAS